VNGVELLHLNNVVTGFILLGSLSTNPSINLPYFFLLLQGWPLL
jgi:hypothetical protein